MYINKVHTLELTYFIWLETNRIRITTDLTNLGVFFRFKTWMPFTATE